VKVVVVVEAEEAVEVVGVVVEVEEAVEVVVEAVEAVEVVEVDQHLPQEVQPLSKQHPKQDQMVP